MPYGKLRNEEGAIDVAGGAPILTRRASEGDAPQRPDSAALWLARFARRIRAHYPASDVCPLNLHFPALPSIIAFVLFCGRSQRATQVYGHV